jgi:hypothetical protein
LQSQSLQWTGVAKGGVNDVEKKLDKIDTRTAATPTREWKAATSWGKSVISMRLAMVEPMAAPPVGWKYIYIEG